jgi:RNA polymerase sigma-70 factor (ECF subfamily)
MNRDTACHLKISINSIFLNNLNIKTVFNTRGDNKSPTSLIIPFSDRFPSREDVKEARVLTAIQEEEQTAGIETWFQECHALVLNAAYRITGNLADAEDVLQTIFTRVLMNSKLLDPDVNVHGYFYRAAVNGALDLLRRRHRIQPLEFVTEEVESLPAPVGNPYEQMRAHELAEWLRRSMLRVSPMAAEVFALSCFEGMDNQEIARLLGSTPNSVAVLLHRTRVRLLRELHEHLGGRS